jgi:hypothetical protein
MIGDSVMAASWFVGFITCVVGVAWLAGHS